MLEEIAKAAANAVSLIAFFMGDNGLLTAMCVTSHRREQVQIEPLQAPQGHGLVDYPRLTGGGFSLVGLFFQVDIKEHPIMLLLPFRSVVALFHSQTESLDLGPMKFFARCKSQSATAVFEYCSKREDNEKQHKSRSTIKENGIRRGDHGSRRGFKTGTQMNVLLAVA
jgi:hypothetical protein